MTSKAYNSKFTEMAKSHPLIPPQVIKELHSGARNAAISEGLKLREKPAEGDEGHEEAESTEEEAYEQPETEPEAPEAEPDDMEEDCFVKDCGFTYPEKNENWIAGAIKNPGALREELGAKEGKNIPAKKLSAAIKKGKKEDATPHEKLTAKRAQLAKTLSKMHK